MKSRAPVTDSAPRPADCHSEWQSAGLAEFRRPASAVHLSFCLSVVTSQSFGGVSGCPNDVSIMPSGLNVSRLTCILSAPLIVAFVLPVATSHNLIVPYDPPA